MKEFITFIVSQIIKDPSTLVISEEREGNVVRIKIHPHPDETGLVIGKAGKTIQSIRNLAKAKAVKDNVKVYVDIE